MRGKLAYFFPLLLLAACGSPTDKEQQVQAVDEIEKAVQIKDRDAKTLEIKQEVNVHACSIFFKVHNHNANECYVDLCFKSENTMEDWQNLQGKCDSLIVGTEEIKRQRVPESEAASLLEISGIRLLKIYDVSGSILPTSFLRVEYLDNQISGSFTAVFQCVDSLPTDSSLYAVLPGNSDELTFKDGEWKCSNVGSVATEDSVLELTNNTYSTYWDFKTGQTVRSFGLSYSGYSTSVSSQHQFLSLGATYNRVYETRDFPISLADVTHAFPTHYFLGDWPVWMLEISVPETDHIYFQTVVPISEDQLEVSESGKLCGK